MQKHRNIKKENLKITGIKWGLYPTVADLLGENRGFDILQVDELIEGSRAGGQGARSQGSERRENHMNTQRGGECCEHRGVGDLRDTGEYTGAQPRPG